METTVMTPSEREFFAEMGESGIDAGTLAAFRAFRPVEPPSPNPSPLDGKKFGNKPGMGFAAAIAKNGGGLFGNYDGILFA